MEALNEARIDWHQEDASTKFSERGVIAINNVLIDHYGQTIEDVGYFWDHVDERYKIALDYLFANSVCTSGKHYRPYPGRRLRVPPLHSAPGWHVPPRWGKEPPCARSFRMNPVSSPTHVP